MARFGSPWALGAKERPKPAAREFEIAVRHDDAPAPRAREEIAPETTQAPTPAHIAAANPPSGTTSSPARQADHQSHLHQADHDSAPQASAHSVAGVSGAAGGGVSAPVAIAAFCLAVTAMAQVARVLPPVPFIAHSVVRVLVVERPG